MLVAPISTYSGVTIDSSNMENAIRKTVEDSESIKREIEYQRKLSYERAIEKCQEAIIGWKVRIKMYETTGLNVGGTSYGIDCADGRNGFVIYNPSMSSHGYFVGLGFTFNTLDEAASCVCNK